jgi:hypothetical protein
MDRDGSARRQMETREVEDNVLLIHPKKVTIAWSDMNVTISSADIVVNIFEGSNLSDFSYIIGSQVWLAESHKH